MTIHLPPWLRRRTEQLQGEWTGRDARKRMRLAIDLARENAQHGGGPFGALVTDADGRLLGLGVNLVVRQRCSLLHAEVVALMMAQKRLAHFDLAQAVGFPILATSVDPCAMCLGALVWSRVRRLECGATTADAEAIGFDEGPKPRTWVAALEKRGIQVVRPLLRQAASEVLKAYQRSGGALY